ncbi:MAG: RloB family protein [Candidatus Paceibacterota bacterium]
MLLNKFKYEKEDPDEDAFHIIIVCEGEKREYQYFKFFSGIDSRLKVKVVPPTDGKTHPTQIFKLAESSAEMFRETSFDQLWIVVDVDHDTDSVKSLIPKVEEKGWHFGLSNPCFEVWLYFHQDESIKEVDSILCNDWKKAVSEVFAGGFNSSKHPTYLKKAIENSKVEYSEVEGLPNEKCTSIHKLGKEIYPLVKDRLDEYLSKD